MKLRYRVWGIVWKIFVALLIALVLWRQIWPAGHDALVSGLGTVLQLAAIISISLMQFVAIFWFMSRSRKTIILPGDPKTKTFSDYWGQDALVESVRSWVDVLRADSPVKELGGKPLRGLLLHGSPGTGKSLLAQCLAAEAKIPFLGVEGSFFRAMFIGIAELKVYSLINQAKKLARQYPHNSAIVYFDEIDAIGMSRGGVQGGQTQAGAGFMGMGGYSGALTTLLSLMDGIGDIGRIDKLLSKIRVFFGMSPIEAPHIFFVGSTNRPDVLDPALTRAGRLDKKIEVPLHDASGRKEVFNGYISKIKADSSDIDLDALVQLSQGMSASDIAQAVQRDAPIKARKRKHSLVTHRDILDSLIENQIGQENPIRNMSPRQREQVAYHESGHAIALHLLLPEDRKVVYLTIVRTGRALGYMMPVNVEETYSLPLDTIEKYLQVALAGHESTILWDGRPWTGASGDLEHVDTMVRNLASLRLYGEMYMGGDMPTSLRKKYNEQIQKSSRRVRTLLKKNWAMVDRVAQALLEKNSLDSREFLEVVNEG